jgi:hypothetical protein
MIPNSKMIHSNPTLISRKPPFGKCRSQLATLFVFSPLLKPLNQIKMMRYRNLLLLIMCVVLFSCKKDKGIVNTPPPPPPPNPPAQTVFLKDVVISSLPSPYYHFEYDAAGKPSFTSVASGFFMYDIKYTGDRVSELRNNIIVNKDRLQYFYDNQGRINLIRGADSIGVVFQNTGFTYNGFQLIKIERERKLGATFFTDKITTFAYHPDGNLMTLTVHRPAVAGQPETTVMDRFEQYDTRVNTDGFSLLHDEFFEHLVFLPNIQLQKNNPTKQARTGDGINYQIDYTYVYNDKNAPLEKRGSLTFSNGQNAGQTIQISSFYSYY